MKKIKFLTPIIVAAAVAVYTMSGSIKEIVTPAKPVEKNISFALYKGSDYNSDVYNSTLATVHITIEKVSRKGRTTVWEKTFDAQTLKQYPSLQQAIAQTVKVPNVFDSKEHLEVSYTLTYNSKGSELQMQNGIMVNGNGTDKVYISI
jgi:hypothetical protein